MVATPAAEETAGISALCYLEIPGPSSGGSFEGEGYGLAFQHALAGASGLPRATGKGRIDAL
jgi:hypothetical protein